MDKIICLVGHSGSGKTTVAKELEKEGYNIIHSYTTRPPRYEGEWGHTFIDEKAIKNIRTDTNDGLKIIVTRKKNRQRLLKAIAFKKLYNDYYFATKEQYQGKGTSIYVVDPDGAEQVKRSVTDAEVVTIFLMADEGIRYKRMVRDRGYGAVERINKDITIFSICKCDYAVDANRSIEEVLADVKEIIKEEC